MNTKIYPEPAKEVPILGEFDVIVGGGGPAGCAAAVYAARHGARTLLVEKDGYLGGATVSQLVAAILSTNGMDLQGIWHEFIWAMKRRGGVHLPERKREDYKVGGHATIGGSLDPEVVKYAWDDLLAEAGVTLLHHAYVAGAIVEDGLMKGILVETKAGRGALFAKRVIDCTGDGAACFQAGVPWEQGDGEHKWAMACTKVFRLGNVHKPEGFPSPEQLRQLEEDFEAAMERNEYTSPIITTGRVLNYIRGWGIALPEYRMELLKVISRVLKVDPVDPWDLTRAEREGREQAWQLADYHRKYVPGCENSYLLDTSNHIGVRSSRRINGVAAVTDSDVLEFHKYPDSIARGSWLIDVWPAESYTVSALVHSEETWMRKLGEGEYYDIRYGAIVAQNVDNLLMAGRCLSAGHLAESSLRIQQTCMATGQAAGTAAALSLKESVTPRELDPMKVVAQLQEDRAATEPAYEWLKDLPIAPRPGL